MSSANPDIEDYLAQLNTTESVKNLFRRYGQWLGWAALSTITLANIATLVSGTIINVAIPHIMGAFGIGQDKAQWLATAFLAASTVTMLMNAWLIHTLGIRNTVIMAMVLFMVGSVIGGISPNTDLLIVARLLQGSATGIITPMGMSLVFMLFPPARQGTVIGVSAIGIVLAPAIGPLVGGLLIDSFNWRYVYLMGVPVSLLVVPLALVFLPPREPDAPSPPLDWVGLILVTLAISSLLIALSNGQREGWSSDFTLGWLCSAVLAGIGFVRWEMRTDHPLLDLRVFGYYRFTMITLLGFLFGAGLYGSTYLVPLFLQIVQGLNATDAGFALLPAGIVMGIMFPIAGKLGDHYDHRYMIGAGFVILGLSFFLMAGGDRNTSWSTFVIWLMISRLGIGIMAPILNLSALRGLPLQYLQQGAGTANFIRQLGGAFGVNLLSVALTVRTSFHADALVATQSYGHSDTLGMLVEIQRNLGGAGAGLTFWEQQYVAYSAMVRLIYQQATEYAFQDGFMILGVVFLATLIPITLLRGKHMRTPQA